MELLDAVDTVELSWHGPEQTSFMQDWQACGEPDEDVRDHVVICRKRIKLRQALIEAAAFAQILQLFGTNDAMVQSVFGVIALAVLAPGSLHLVRDDEAQLLKVIHKLQQGWVVNESHLRALVRVNSNADRLIGVLVDKGFVRRLADGTLAIARPVLTSFHVGNIR